MTEPKLISIEMMNQMLKQQREDFSAMVTGLMSSFNERYDKLKDAVTEIRVSLEYSQEDIAAIRDTIKLQNVAEKTINKELSSVQERLQEIEGTIDYLENQSRRNNLIFDGIPEGERETWQDSEDKVLEVLEDSMDLNNITVERAHRVGRSNTHRGRSIVVKFLKFKDRETVLRNGKKLKGTSIYVREDFSEKILAKRRALMPQLREARDNGKIAYFSYDRLIIKDRQIQLDQPLNDAITDESTRIMTRSQSTQGK